MHHVSAEDQEPWRLSGELLIIAMWECESGDAMAPGTLAAQIRVRT